MIPEYKTTILDIQTVARDTKKYIFSKPSNWTYKAGQFISLKFTERAFRAYSIASHPDEKNIELVIRLIAGGLGSTVLAQSKLGDEFSFRGAFGHFGLTPNTLPLSREDLPNSVETKHISSQKQEKNHLYFCATGTGIAPFRAMIIDEMKQVSPRTMTLLYGGRNADDIAYLDEVRTWSDPLNICLALSRESDAKILNTWSEKIRAKVIEGRITDFLEQKNPNCHPAITSEERSMSEFYICGNGDMVVSVRKILLEQGVDKKQIIQERFN